MQPIEKGKNFSLYDYTGYRSLSHPHRESLPESLMMINMILYKFCKFPLVICRK